MTPRPRSLRPFSGRALDAAALLAAAHPGLLHLLRAWPLRRQASFAALACLDPAHPEPLLARLDAVAMEMPITGHDNPLARLARHLVRHRARPIVEAVLGSCPDGYLGLLARLGADPRPLALYRLAHALYREPQHRRRAKILRQIEGTASAGHIYAACALRVVHAS